MLISGSPMSKDDVSENIADSVEVENSNSISRIRSLFVDPGFPFTQPQDADNAEASKDLPDSEA